MYKKILISFLVFAFINFIAGCSSFHSVSVSEYKQVEEEEGKPIEIYVKTKTNLWYHFTNSNFYIENDTLYGRGELLLSDEEGMINTKIALSDIESMGVEGTNWVITSFLGFLAITVVVVFVIFVGWLFSQ